MRRIYLCLIYLFLFTLINSRTLDGSMVQSHNVPTHSEFSHLTEVLYDLKHAELLMCISFVRNPDLDSKQIADFIFEWNPQEHKKTMASVFRTKITKLTDRLKRVDYQQLIVDIDLIKNCHLNTGQIIKIIKSEQRQ